MEITWKVESISCIPQVNEYSDVVYDIAWRTFATEGDHSTSVYGTVVVSFDPDEVVKFTPYEELTEEQVLGWVFDAYGEDGKLAIEDNVSNALLDLITPKIVTNPLPWNTTE